MKRWPKIFWATLTDFEINFDTQFKTEIALKRLTSIINKELKNRKLERQTKYLFLKT